MKRTLQDHPLIMGLALLLILLFVGLKLRDYYAPLPDHERNKKEISRIKAYDPSDFTFAVFGDNKGNISIFKPLLRDIDDRIDIDFAIDLGDLVDGGNNAHYRRFLNQLQDNLAIPVLAVIGNHDLSKGGSSHYQEIFGPTYYSFQIGQGYFTILDAISEQGFDKTERKWLEDELKKAQVSKARFVFMHVPPFDPRGGGFDKCLPERDRRDLLDLFRRYNVTHLFASHIHGYFTGVWEGVPYTITGGGGAGLQGSGPQHFFHHYVEVHVNDGKVDTLVRQIDSEDLLARLYDQLVDSAVEWALLFGAGIALLTLGLFIWGEHRS